MFDKLVESSKQKQGRRAGRYLMATTVIYTIAVALGAVGTIVGMSPVLAERYSLKSILTPPPPPPTPERLNVSIPERFTANNIFVTPPRPAPTILPATDAHKFAAAIRDTGVIGMTSGSDLGSGYVPGGRETFDPPPPPPETKSKKIEDTPAREIKPQGTQKFSEGVLQGIAIKKVKPVYPLAAKKVRLSGSVQVQVMISEEGRVIEAAILSGHPVLRGAAIDAARQWLFTPTKLSNVPVKVQGVLTFNFVLE